MKRCMAGLLFLLMLAVPGGAWGGESRSYIGMIDIEDSAFKFGMIRISKTYHPDGPDFIYFPLHIENIKKVFPVCEVGDICKITGELGTGELSVLFMTISRVELVEKFAEIVPPGANPELEKQLHDKILFLRKMAEDLMQ